MDAIILEFSGLTGKDIDGDKVVNKKFEDLLKLATKDMSSSKTGPMKVLTDQLLDRLDLEMKKLVQMQRFFIQLKKRM